MSSFRNGLLAAAFQYILGLIILCVGFSAGAVTPEGSGRTPAIQGLTIQALDPSITDATISEVTSGSLDAKFNAPNPREQASRGEVIWLRVASPQALGAGAIPAILVHAGMLHQVEVYAASSGKPLPVAAKIPEFAGARDTAFILPSGSATAAAGPPTSSTAEGASLDSNAATATSASYVRIVPPGAGYGVPRVTVSTLDEILHAGNNRERIISLAFGALAAMAVASFL